MSNIKPAARREITGALPGIRGNERARVPLLGNDQGIGATADLPIEGRFGRYAVGYPMFYYCIVVEGLRLIMPPLLDFVQERGGRPVLQQRRCSVVNASSDASKLLLAEVLSYIT